MKGPSLRGRETGTRGAVAATPQPTRKRTRRCRLCVGCSVELRLAPLHPMPTNRLIVAVGVLAVGVQPALGLHALVRPASVQLRAAGPTPGAVAARSRAPQASAVSAVLRPFAGPIAALAARPVAVGAVVVALATVLILWLVRLFNTPSRSYQDGERESGGINSVGKEYDAWTSEGILEYYWGEHIHLGYYQEGQRKAPFYGGKNFIEAKYDFIDKMLECGNTGPQNPHPTATMPCLYFDRSSVRAPWGCLCTQRPLRSAPCSAIYRLALPAPPAAVARHGSVVLIPPLGPTAVAPSR
eukprot:scaffold26069_cov118-Isochrysis_galbana.AAC.1